MIRMQDLGEVGFGAAVTLGEWWDQKQIQEGKIASNEMWKRIGLWVYLGIGVPATLMSAFGWWKRQELLLEHVSHGFLYDLPRFIYNLVQTMGAGKRGGQSAAVKEAQRILQQTQHTRQLAEGRAAERSYQPEFATSNNIVL